jgi:hypothetical protein
MIKPSSRTLFPPYFSYGTTSVAACELPDTPNLKPSFIRLFFLFNPRMEFATVFVLSIIFVNYTSIGVPQVHHVERISFYTLLGIVLCITSVPVVFRSVSRAFPHRGSTLLTVCFSLRTRQERTPLTSCKDDTRQSANRGR